MNRRMAAAPWGDGMVGLSDQQPAYSAMYTLKQLEAFYWSAVLGSFSASSRKLHTTQSAVAKRVGELEGFAGTPLFERRAKSLVLTQPGRKLFEGAREMLELNSRMVLDMADPSRFEGSVRLGVTELVALTSLAGVIERLNQRYPKIQLVPEIEAGITMYQQLERDELDLAIMPGPFWSYEYDCVQLGSVTNVWMASPALALDAARALTPHDLAPFPVISQPQNSALSHLYDAWFAQQGLSVKRVLTCNSLAMMAQLTMLGLGISHLPSAYFDPLVARGALCRLRVQPDLPTIHYYAVYKKSLINPVVSTVIDIARETCNFEVEGAFLPLPPGGLRSG
ncbi:LysR family transcriptional regulator [Bordetella pertussis]|nr:LysR family transcriptional regulator [Bordetella pertussis]CFN44885.1 LysR family transcriptional regulator [Bordetella pertussis]CFO30364.1 LysR family transcriptional regulator [Bordetella pertussis]CFO96358.1 LysR family transcriptional regulator [Bordetella pertussis]CFP42499.1 LysR family transcriptional regulator [Bordetella pertussis]